VSGLKETTWALKRQVEVVSAMAFN
jgi:hypothetical protein